MGERISLLTWIMNISPRIKKCRHKNTEKEKYRNKS